jgi:hypothetical protein
MKNNQFTFILVGVFFLMTLGTVVLGVKFNSSVREYQAIEVKHKMLVNTQFFLNQLSATIAEYSKKDPAINSMIQSFANASANPAAMLPSKTPAK